MKTLKNTLFIAMFIATSMAFSQIRTYNDLKTNADGMVDRNGFGESYSKNYTQWDRDADTRINDRDFYNTTYTRLDRDRDSNLSQDEWDYGHQNFYGDFVKAEDYTTLDLNKDGKVSDIEYYNGFKGTQYYTSYDVNRDGNISAEEMNQSVFDNWDRNRDGFLDQKEYDDYGNMYYDIEN